jgi:hypothetical protein
MLRFCFDENIKNPKRCQRLKQFSGVLPVVQKGAKPVAQATYEEKKGAVKKVQRKIICAFSMEGFVE